MKKFRFFLAAVLCISLMTFAGCGADDTDKKDNGSGTVKEETVDRTDDNDRKDGDSLTEDMADDAKDAIDDVEDTIDGDHNDNSSKESSENKKPNN